MKIVALMASPRKGGNTDLLTDALLAGAKKNKAKVKKIALNKLDIRGCQACYACSKTGKCKQKDGMKKVYKQLLSADVWVLATPVYWWGPAAQLKLAMDRLFPFCHPENGLPEKIKGKKIVLLTASADDPKVATPHLKGMVDEGVKYMKLEWAGELLVQAYKRGEVKKNQKALDQAAKLGEKIASGK